MIRPAFVTGLALTLVAGTGACAAPSESIHTLRLEAPAGMTRAELRYRGDPKGCAGVLVLCPGYNGDGATLFSPGWDRFAADHRLAVVGLSFASAEADLSPGERRGYYYVEKGSGATLLAGLRRLTGRADTPIVIFGFSGGAHFAHRFTYQHPDRVRTWAAYGFGWYDEPRPGSRVPPGVLACGLEDERLPQTVGAFLAARRAKAPVCWLGLPHVGHAVDEKALDRIRSYFSAELARPPGTPDVWRTLGDRGLEGFLVQHRFPTAALADDWAKPETAPTTATAKLP